MNTNILSEDKDGKQNVSRLQEFEQAHIEDLKAIVEILAKITNKTSEEIKPHFEMMLERLVQTEERPFYETATPQEWVQAFHEWVESHRDMNLPQLSDEAISRESIYGERG
jgi:hypothetical protein